MQCEQYTIRMTMTEEEITMLLAAITGYRVVVGVHSKGILSDLERLIKYQIKSQDKAFEKKYLEEREKNRKNT